MGPSEKSNTRKYQTSNPVVKRLINAFYSRLIEIIGPLSPTTVLDAGCGEGETLRRLISSLPKKIDAIDVDPECIHRAVIGMPNIRFSVQTIYDLHFEPDSFDLVLCLEVLEHLQFPEKAVIELARVCRKDLIISVPHEPLFRIGSFLRGKYISRLGNHPEHLWKWNRESIKGLLAKKLDLIQIYSSLPWLLIHARKHRIE